MLINVYCEDKGWLFEDLKREIVEAGDGDVVASEYPIAEADAFICVRTRDAKHAINPERTLVQVHDLDCKPVRGFGMVSFVHDDAMDRWKRKGFDGPCFVEPIGARNVPASPVPDRPTIGFFCREIDGKKGSGLFAQAVCVARQRCDFDVLMIGANLDHIADLGAYEYRERGAGVDDYSRISALVVLSESTMVPLSAYEALAGGVRVISSPRNWPGDTGAQVLKPDGLNRLVRQIVSVTQNPSRVTPIRPYRREAWARSQVEAARKLATQPRSITKRKRETVALWVHPNSHHQKTHLGALEYGLRRHGIQPLLTTDVRSAVKQFGVVACWGWRKGRAVNQAGRTAMVLERGYVGDRKRWTSLGFDGLNGHATFPETPDDGGNRLRQFHANALRPWNPQGRYILIAGQVPGDQSLQGQNLFNGWYDQIADEAAERYGLPVYFRPHPLAAKRGGKASLRSAPNMGGELTDALNDAAMVITYNSNTSVDAALAGKPVTVFDRGSMALEVASLGFPDRIPTDEPESRTQWAERLVWKQWALEEIRNGEAVDHALPMLLGYAEAVA